MPLLKIATIVGRTKEKVLQLRQKSNNNQDNNNDGKHVGETACVGNSGKD